MDLYPYKKRRQHKERKDYPSLATSDDALANTPVMTIEPLSHQRRPIYQSEPTKIGVSYRTRRRRRYSKPGEDSDVSVISYDSGTTFGRFSQHSQSSPNTRQSLSSPYQQSDTQQSTKQASQLAFPPKSYSSVSRNQQYTTRSQPPTHPKPSTSVSDTHKSASRPHLQADLVSLDAEKFNERDSWTTVNNVNSSNETRQSPAAKYAETAKPTLYQQQATYTNNDRNIDEYMDTEPQFRRRTTPLPSPSTKIVEMLSDNEEEDRLELSRLQQTYKLLPALRDEQILQTLSWTMPEETDHMTRPSTSSQDKYQADPGTISNQTETAPKKRLYTINRTATPEAIDEQQATPPPSQKALGKRRANETGAGFPGHTHQQDKLSMDIQQSKTPSPANEMKERSPSVLSIHDDNYQSDDRIKSPPMEPGKELEPPASSGFNYGADAFDMDNFSAQDMETDQEPSDRPIQPIPRISPHANLTRKIIQKSQSQTTKQAHYIPLQSTKSLFESALPSGVALRTGDTKALAEASRLFFEQLLNDLEAYGNHSRESIIDQKDIELLMSRQRLLTESISLEALAHKHLPRDFWDELCVSALASNYLYPKRNR